MITLYHGRAAVCAQKVRLALAEKRLAWTSVEVDFADPAFMRRYKAELNPNGVVPTLVVDGQPIIESNVILQYLEEAYPAIPLLPADPLLRARARVWLSQLDIDVHTAINALSFAIVFRHRFLAMTPEQRAAAYAGIPDTTRRQRRIDLVENGMASPLVAVAVERFMLWFADLEAALQGQDYLVGGAYGLADLALTPYLARLTALGFGRIWPRYPALAGWWERLRARENYAQAFDDWGITGPGAEELRLADAAWAAVETLMGKYREV